MMTTTTLVLPAMPTDKPARGVNVGKNGANIPYN